jgi:nitroreductase
VHHQTFELSAEGLSMLNKTAITDSPIHELIRMRWSPRAFAATPVTPEVLRSLFEAARWAPSSNNEQPWSYIVAIQDDKVNFDKIAGVLGESNAVWAANAPMLAIAVARLTFAKNNAPNRSAQYDVGGATALLSLEATSRGLFVHQMAGFDREKAREVFGIPAEYEALAVLAIGYPGDPASLSEKLQARELAPRTRKPLSEFLMTGSWGHAAPFLAK